MYENLYAQEQSAQGIVVANAYRDGSLMGWREELAADAWKVVGGMVNRMGSPIFKPLGLDAAPFIAAGQKTLLYQVCRKVLGKDTPNYPQQIGDCGIAGTQVLMESGDTKNIEDVQVGDYVITHLNRPRRVVRTIKKKYNGQLITLKGKKCHQKVTMTTDHQFVCYDANDPYRYKWTPVGKLVPAIDFVLIPFGIQNVEFQYVEYDGRKILVDDDFARIIGLYLAEGGITSKMAVDGMVENHQKVTFNLGSHEEWLVDDIVKLLRTVFDVDGKRYYHKAKQHVLLVEVHNSTFATFLKTLVAGNVYSKGVPPIVLRSPRIVKVACLKGWLDGDGHLSKAGQTLSGATSSGKLFDSMYRLCLSCELLPSSYFAKKAKHQRVAAGILYFGQSQTDKILGTRRQYKRCYTRTGPLGLITPVESVMTEEARDIDVFCLEVDEDHSFVANGYAVKNCVSMGGKNAAEYLTCLDIVLRGTHEKWRPVFPPYYYGTSRVQIGGQHDRQDGSTGAWLAAAVVKYGTLFADEPSVPPYSGQVASDWGYSGPPAAMIPIAQKYLVHSAALINSWDDLVAAISNGYPCTTASNVGYEMLPGSDGFHHRSQPWGHQLCFIGVGFNPEPYAIIVNSWGPVHGSLKDFDDQHDLPVGVLRVRKADAAAHIAAGETYAWSQFDGFPEQDIPDALWKVVGN